MSITELIQSGQCSEALTLIDTSSLNDIKKEDLRIKIYLQLKEFCKAEESIGKLVNLSHDRAEMQFKAELYSVDLHVKSGRAIEAKELINNIDFNLDQLDGDDREGLEILGLYYHLLGTVYLIQGYTKQAEQELLKAKEYRVKHPNQQDLAGTINNLGVVYRRQGLLHKAIDYYKQALNIFEHLDNEQMVAMSRNNLGIIHASRGELMQSKQYHEENLVFYTDKGDMEQIARSLNNLGSVYKDLGDYEYAEKLYMESIQFRLEGDNPQNLFTSYYNLSLCLIDAGKLDEVDQYLLELEKLLQDNATPRNRLHYEFVVAMSYYRKSRLKSKIQAMQKFEKLAEMDFVDPDVSFQSIMMLIELLFFELMSLNNTNLLNEIVNYLDLLEEQTLKTSHYLYYLKSKLLRAKLSMILGDIEKAEEVYQEALEIATRHKLSTFKQHIREELDSFREEIHKWVDLSEQQQSLLDRIRSSMITNYLNDVKNMVQNDAK